MTSWQLTTQDTRRLMTFCKSSVWVCKSLCVCVYVYAWQSGRGSLVTSGAFQSTLGSQCTARSLRAGTCFFTHSTPHANHTGYYGGESKAMFFCYRTCLSNIFILSQCSCVTVLIISDSSASQPDRTMIFFRIVRLGKCCHINNGPKYNGTGRYQFPRQQLWQICGTQDR